MKRLLAGVILCLVSAPAAIAAEEWIEIAKSSTNTFSVKLSTLSLKKNKAGDLIVAGIGRSVHDAKNEVNIEQWYVRTADCETEYGKLVTLSTDGTYLYENEFAFDSGNIASAKAESLCYFYRAVKENAEKKGI